MIINFWIMYNYWSFLCLHGDARFCLIGYLTDNINLKLIIKIIKFFNVQCYWIHLLSIFFLYRLIFEEIIIWDLIKDISQCIFCVFCGEKKIISKDIGNTVGEDTPKIKMN